MSEIEVAGGIAALSIIAFLLLGLVALGRCEPRDIAKVLRELLRRRRK